MRRVDNLVCLSFNSGTDQGDGGKSQDGGEGSESFHDAPSLTLCVALLVAGF
jgi:hypothetical protein